MSKTKVKWLLAVIILVGFVSCSDEVECFEDAVKPMRVEKSKGMVRTVDEAKSIALAFINQNSSHLQRVSGVMEYRRNQQCKFK